MRALLVIKHILVVGGLVTLMAALFTYNASNDFLAAANSTSGSVIALLEDADGDSISYRPIVKFLSGDGREVRFSEPIGSNPSAYSVGQEVTVLYAPDSPQGAKLNSFSSLWGIALILAVLGGSILLIAGLVTLVAGRKLSPKKDNLIRVL